MIVKEEFRYLSANRKDMVHAMRWLPETARPIAVLQIVHGIGEHIGRYETFANYMALQGYIVVGASLLGHGKTVSSPEDIGFFAEKDGWDIVVSDVASLHRSQAEKYSDHRSFED